LREQEEITQAASATLNIGGTTLSAARSMHPQAETPSATRHRRWTGGQRRDLLHLNLNNTSGTDTAGGVITVNGALVTTAGGTLDMSTFALGGTPTSITANGSTKNFQYSGTPIPAGFTWGGTFTMRLLQETKQSQAALTII